MLLLTVALTVLAAAPSARGAGEPEKSDACPALTKQGAAPLPDPELDTRPNSDRLRCQADEQLHQGDEQLRQYLGADEANQRLVDAQTAYFRLRPNERDPESLFTVLQHLLCLPARAI